MALEKTITNSILMYLNKCGFGVSEKVQGSASCSGKPDINACYKGRSLRIEVKTQDHGNTPSEKQLLNLERWYRAGAIVMVAYNLPAVKELLHMVETKKELEIPCYAKDGLSWVKLKASH